MNDQTDYSPKDGNVHTHSPEYWIKVFDGTPLSIIVPPYIRFLHGQIFSLNAQAFLITAFSLAKAGQPELEAALRRFGKLGSPSLLRVTVEGYFAGHQIAQLVSEVEYFLACSVSAALRLHPKKMGSQKFELADIISAESTDALIDRAARTYLNEIMYEKPADYIKKFADVLSIESDKLQEVWPRFVELKARRDLGLHNNWIVNDIYLRKVKEVKLEKSLKIGDSALPDHQYINSSHECCSELVDKIVNLLGEKWIPKTK